MKKLVLFVGIVILGLGLFACSSEPYDAYVTIDINPSVGFIVDEADQVQSAYALNEDGELLLMHLEVQNKSLEQALNQVIDGAMELGFIDVDAEETTIEIDASANDEAIQERLRTRVKDHVADAMEQRQLNAKVQNHVYSQAELDKANGNSLSPVQQRLVEKAMEIDPELTEDDALEASPEQLMTRMRTQNETPEIVQALKDEFLAAKQAIHDTYLPQIQELEAQIEAASSAGEDTTELEAELAALKEEMHTALMAVVDEFLADSELQRQALQTQLQARIQANQEKVEAYRNQHQITTTTRLTSENSSTNTSNTATSNTAGN